MGEEATTKCRAAASAWTASTLVAAALDGGQPGFRLIDHFVGFFVLDGIIAGFAPLLLSVFELVLRIAAIERLGLGGARREDRHPIRQDLAEAPGHNEEILIIAALAAVQAHVADAQLGQERSMPVERLDVTGPRGNLDGIG